MIVITADHVPLLLQLSGVQLLLICDPLNTIDVPWGHPTHDSRGRWICPTPGRNSVNLHQVRPGGWTQGPAPSLNFGTMKRMVIL